MISKWYMCLLLFILLTGCSSMNGEHDFSENVKSIEQAFQKPDWKQLQSLGNDLKQLYLRNKWKIQLIGDEDEYESLQESINHFIVAIEEKDLTESKLEMATIKTFIEDIYSL